MDSPEGGSASESFSEKSDSGDEEKDREEREKAATGTDDEKGGEADRVEEESEEVEEVVALIKGVTTLFDLSEDDWKTDTLSVIRQFIVTPTHQLLVIYYSGLALVADIEFPRDPVHDLMYYLRRSEITVTPINFFEVVMFGNLNGNVEGSMLNLCQNIYAPIMFRNSTWPEGFKRELTKKFHEFLGLVTDVHYKLHGFTALYVPIEDSCGTVEECSKDKDYVRRLEGIMNYWTKQIRVAVHDIFEVSSSSLLTPTDEFKFWEYRWKTLNMLLNQLREPEVRRVIEILTMSQSSNIVHFNSLVEEMTEAVEVAISNIQFLEMLLEPCQALNMEMSADKIPDHLPRLLNLVRCIWVQSHHYNTPEKLMPLCRDLTNQVILRCKSFVNVSGIFDDGLVQKAVSTLTANIRCCRKFKVIYNAVAEAHTARNPELPWKLDEGSIFNNLDAFIRRNQDLIDICEAIVTFTMKESSGGGKTLLGGAKGLQFMRVMDDVEAQFRKSLEEISAVRFDILNVLAPTWLETMPWFRNQIRHLERQLENLLSLAFEQATNLEEGLLCLQAFFHYSRRPVIARLLEEKTTELWAMLLAETDAARQQIFGSTRFKPASTPVFSGPCFIAHLCLKRLKNLSSMIQEAEWLPQVGVGEDALSQLQCFEDRVTLMIKARFKEWSDSVEEGCMKRLEIPLLRRSTAQPGLLETNLDPLVSELAKECLYWELLEFTPPHPAKQIALQWPRVRKLNEEMFTLVLDHNIIISSLTDEERLLFKELIKKIETKISPSIFRLMWNVDPPSEFITECYKHTTALIDFVADYKKALLEMTFICEKICDTKLINITPAVVFELNDLENEIETYRTEALITLIQLYQDLLIQLTVIFDGFEDVLAVTGQHWHKFILRLDSMMEEALVLCVTQSLQTMLSALNGDAALLKVSLNLEEAKDKIQVTFNPPLNRVSSIGTHFLAEVVGAFKVIPRIYDKVGLTGMNPKPFYACIESNQRCQQLQGDINRAVAKNVRYLQKYIEKWVPYREVWELKKDDAMAEYEEKKPTASEWDKDIARFGEVGLAVTREDPMANIEFTFLDSTPLKLAIAQHIAEWKSKLYLALLKQTDSAVQKVLLYCNEKSALVKEEPKNLTELADMISRHENLIADVQLQEEVFPITETYFAILEKYDVKLPKNVADGRTLLPTRWSDYLKALEDGGKMLEEKKEVFKAGLLEQCEQSKLQINDVLADFAETGRFTGYWSAIAALKYLAKVQEELDKLNKREAQLRTDLSMFGVSYPENFELRQLQTDVLTLSTAWGIVLEWDNLWADYKDGNFWTLNMDEMEDKTLEISKTLARVGVELVERGWNITDAARAHIESVRRCIPLITQLKNPAMRERHWRKIKELARREFDPQSKAFTMGAILDMKLQDFVTEIFEISKTASFELNIELGLIKIEDIWSKTNLAVEPFKELKGVYKLKDVDDIILTLEENLTSLAAMKGTKFVEPFINDVQKWEKTLTTVDEVLDLLLTVQRQWLYLENIFTGEDIRVQLPNETAHYEGLTRDWRTISTLMHDVVNAVKVSLSHGLQKKLTEMVELLEEIQKALEIYLETKRHIFPRFYFISNDDLLEILGNSKKPELIQSHFKKLFDNINRLKMVKNHLGKTEGLSMVSGDGEVIDFLSPILCDGAVERWLCSLEDVMRTTLRAELKSTRFKLRKMKKDKWLKEQPGQLCIVSSQIQWTTDCTRTLMVSAALKDRFPIRKLRKKLKKGLRSFSDILRTNLTKSHRMKVTALVTIDIHAADVVDALYKSSCMDTSAFGWYSQLRFYWDKNKEDCVVKQTNTSFDYGYEYLGNSGRLCVTPLTDRCYITLTTALHLNRGGSPKGPAGTGKTETVKDLGKGLGAFVIVFNCSEGLDYKSMGRLFSGLAQTGAWGCFDEFNRINVEVLSVVAQQILSILSALSAAVPTFHFEGENIKLVLTCGIFITMNPGYAGRTELPDNLKAMFRPIAMVVPDSALIAEVTLFGEGFIECRSLANKAVTLFKLASQQLSKQDHYDFGLRSLVALLRYAGAKRRELLALSDEEILLLAMRDMNVAKLTSGDLRLFNAISQDLFPGVDSPVVDQSILLNAIANEMRKVGLQPVPAMVKKVVQLYETQQSRHSVMMVGETMTGKTTTWKLLKASLISLQPHGYPPAMEYSLNPKTLSLGEIFGEFNLATGEWLDGVVSSIMRKVCAEDTPERKWVLFDGPVDAVWIENMNSAMDDNKLLTLINSERISMPEQVSFLFEVENLRVASPATVSRAAMVYSDYKSLGWRPFVDSWLESLKSTKLADELREHMDRLLPRVLEFKRLHCTELMATHELACVRSLCRLIESFFTEEFLASINNPDALCSLAKMFFLFCLTWSVGGALDTESRRKLDTYIRETESVFPVKGTIYDYYADTKLHSMLSWETQLNENWKYNPASAFHELIVPTVDTVRYEMLVSSLLTAGYALLLLGPVGAGKTCVMKRVLNQRTETVLCASLSAQTSAPALQQLIESRLEKRTKGVFAPVGGKRMFIFLDDLNMPSPDTYGSQPPLELIRTWMDYGFWYDRQKQTKKFIKDVVMICAMGPVGGGRNIIPNRLLSRFATLGIAFPDHLQICHIYRSLLQQHVFPFDENVKAMVEPLTHMTVDLFTSVVDTMLPTPNKTHYLFNLRDVSRVFQGLLRSHRNFHNDPARLLRLWTHEIHRVFADRLVDEADRGAFSSMVDVLLSNYFEETISSLCPDKRLPIFGDFASDFGVYEDFPDLAALRKTLEKFCEEYNKTPGVVPLNIVFFKDAIEHACRIIRVLSQPRGHLLLVGIGGSGRTLLSRLALYICNYRTFSISITRNYKVGEFREDLKVLYKLTGVEHRPTGFILAESQIVAEDFLEIMNSILGTGEVPNLFKPEELDEIKNNLLDAAAKKGVMLTNDNALNFLVERSRNMMHVVLCMSPATENFRRRLQRYPALVGCTTIDWFMLWPPDALNEVAVRSIESLTFTERIFFEEDEEIDYNALEKQLRASIAEIFARIHGAVEKAAQLMLRQMRRITYVTPTSFLNLITSYIKFLVRKREELRMQAKKLKSGLGRIDEARDSVADMTVLLERTQAKVLVIQQECEVAIQLVASKRKEADEQATIVKNIVEKIAEEEVACRAMTRAAQADLDEALPALEEAMAALDALSKKDISEMKSYGRPPPKVMLVMEAVCILKGTTPDWAESKRLLGEQDFLKSLREFDKENISEKTMKRIAQYTQNEEFTPESVETVSMAAGSLCMWVHAIENFGKLWRVVGPKKARLDEAIASLHKKQEEAQKLQSQLAEIQKVVDQLNEELAVKTTEMEEVKLKADDLQLKLERADMLVDGLAGEKIRWEQTVSTSEASFINLPGDSLIGAAFLTYAGPFVSQYRDQLLAQWNAILAEYPDITCTPGLKLLEFLIDPAVVRDWNSIGLPSDDFSVQNGVLVVSSSRWPVVIDPQSQANKWIKNMEEKNDLTVVDLEDKKLMMKLENCILGGKPLLLQNVPEKIDLSLSSVLGKRLIVEAGEVVLMLGDKMIAYNENFRLYVTTKLGNPHFLPEVCTMTTIVNFALKQEGLQAQMLALVVRRERPELEESKTRTLHTISSGRKTLQRMEEELLQLLYETEGSLLENEKLFNTLQISKITSQDVTESLEAAVTTEAEIDAARLEYVPAAERAAILFVSLSDLGQVDPMYQFSLDAYINLFSLSLEKSTKCSNLAERIVHINEYHTYAVYKNTCRVLFAHHKLIFSFYVCVNILKALGKIPMEQIEFLLRGGVVLSREGHPANPNPRWLSETMWDNVVELEKVPGFQGIVRSFEDDTRSWQSWCQSKAPEKTPLVGDWDRASDFNRLLFVRALREDRLLIVVSTFVERNLGRPFIEQPVLDVRDVLDDSNARVPLIFILSPGEDPTSILLQVAESKKMRGSLLSLSLGQGQSEAATRCIERGIEEGRWVFLANCHLARSWMPALDKIVEGLHTRAEVHPNFRLWLSSSPDESFPISILQDGLKMTTQSPSGLRANLSRLYATLTDALYERCPARNKYTKLLFPLAFFHGVLLGRKKFQQLGWNVNYSFNDSDFEVSEHILGMYLEEDAEVNWDALHYLIAQVNYGGHVTDDWDRRVLMTYASQYFCNEALTTNKYKLSSLPTYYIPDDGKLDSIKDYISMLPVADDPEAFGQHPNAEFSHFIASATDLCRTLQTLNAQAAEAADSSQEGKVLLVAEEILSQLPQELDLESTEKNFLGDLGPLEVVLLQEGARYNSLLSVVAKTLKDVQLGISGRILMTPELENAFNCLLFGKVPPAWLRAYSSLKPLGSWTRDLFARIEHLSQWATSTRAPTLFWAVAFTFPTGFLTAVLQKASRAKGIAVDLLAWEFVVMSEDESDITEAPGEGIYLRGLFLEGGGWDRRGGTLAEPQPLQLITPMPVLWLKPTEVTRKKAKGMYVCPSYYYPERSGSFVVAVDLPTGKEPPETWIKCGTALLLSTA